MAAASSHVALVRYGAVPEVSRFAVPAAQTFGRGERVVIRTRRGLELGTTLEVVKSVAPEVANHHHADHETESNATDDDAEESVAGDTEESAIVRRATRDDEALGIELQQAAERDFADWSRRIGEWGLQLELIDLEWTIDRSKLLLYVLGDRGPDSTQLAIYAAAAGLPALEVQPVNADGPVPVAAGGGGGHGSCGNCGH